MMVWYILEYRTNFQVRIHKTSFWKLLIVAETNGPIFMPNTILMQDLTRLAFDQYLEEEETRKPVLISLKKGICLNHTPTATAYIAT